jgi:hypothetical protein
VSQIFEFVDEKERMLTLAMLQGIEADLDTLSHPAVSEPELDIRRQVLGNVQRIVASTNYKGQYGDWRRKGRRTQILGTIGFSVFFIGLWLFDWWMSGKWWNGVGNVMYALGMWAYLFILFQWQGSQEFLDQLKLKLPPLNLPNGKSH